MVADGSAGCGQTRALPRRPANGGGIGHSFNGRSVQAPWGEPRLGIPPSANPTYSQRAPWSPRLTPYFDPALL